jgi:hypothetical protein
MNIRLTGRGTLARTAAVSVAALAVLGLWAPAAQAAPATVITLDPGSVELSLRPSNGGALQTYSAPTDAFATPVSARFGGSVTFTIPPRLASADAVLNVTVRVDDPAVPDGSNVAIYSRIVSDPLVEQPLVVADLGGGTFQVTMPADDGVHGPEAVLSLGPLVPTAGTPGTTFIDPAHWRLALSSSGPASATLTSQIIAVACAPNAGQSGCPTAATKVPWGGELQFTLPTGSKLDELGVTTLNGMAQPGFMPAQDLTSWPPSSSPYGWNYTTSADGRTATLLMFGPDLQPGKYVVTIAVGDRAGTPELIAYVGVPVEIVRAPNQGLRSNTGWGEHEAQAPAGTSPLVPIGATMILTAGAGTALVLRRRTASQV